MTRATKPQLTAALILARQAVALLEEALAPPKPGPRSQPATARTPRPWHGRTLDLTDDEHTVLQALADGADDAGTYHHGRDTLARACRMGAHRLRTALEGLTDAQGGRAPVSAVNGPHGRTDYALTATGEDRPQG